MSKLREAARTALAVWDRVASFGAGNASLDPAMDALRAALEDAEALPADASCENCGHRADDGKCCLGDPLAFDCGQRNGAHWTLRVVSVTNTAVVALVDDCEEGNVDTEGRFVLRIFTDPVLTKCPWKNRSRLHITVEDA